MLKPLETEFKGRTLTLECAHKKAFPPPQMYGHTPEDVDTLWKQGVVDQNQYQHLKVWQESCGLMVMGPKCLDCPLALKQNPRPGRPHVIEVEPWLPAKEKIHWEDMAANKGTLETRRPSVPRTTEEPSSEVVEANVENTLKTEGEEPPKAEVEEPPVEQSEESVEEETPVSEEAPGLDEDILDALAKD